MSEGRNRWMNIESLSQASSKARAMGAPPRLSETLCPVAAGPGCGLILPLLAQPYLEQKKACSVLHIYLILRISKLDSASKLELAHLITSIGMLSSTGARMWVKLMVSWGQSQDGCLGPELWSGALLSQVGRQGAS